MDLLNLISQNTYTLSDLKRRARILKEFLEAGIFGANSEIASDSDSAWLNSLPADLKNKFNNKNIYTELENLKSQVNKIQPMVIYLSFQLPDIETEKLARQIRQQLNSNLFIDIKVDQSLIGGAAFVYKGVYKDYSLRKRLEEQKDQILTQMKRYIS